MMKLFHKRDSDSNGHIHILIPILAIVAVGVIGGIVMLRGSHAASLCSGQPLRSGSTVPCVKDLQALLDGVSQARRFSISSAYGGVTRAKLSSDNQWYLNVDGSFGDGTNAAVKAFQRAYTIRIDGIVGPQTWLTLCTAATVNRLNTSSAGAPIPGHNGGLAYKTAYAASCQH
ncbi:MAG TPA: peptidoglycan-binding protein [Candidatus Saccharimonadales bacterium]|nr:peptidoglycan-binding protein [Candidatus Saccharimonadales bacterium]